MYTAEELVEYYLSRNQLSLCDVDPFLKQKLKENQDCSPEFIKRLVRFTCINHSLKQNGLYALHFDANDTRLKNRSILDMDQMTNKEITEEYSHVETKKKEADEVAMIRAILLNEIHKRAEALSAEDKLAAKMHGLTSEEYVVIKGTFGTFSGLELERGAYSNLIALLKMQTKYKYVQDNHACHAYLLSKLKSTACRRMRYPENLKFIRDIYSRECTLLKALRLSNDSAQ